MTAAERGDKHQVKLNPKSGAAIWLIAPKDSRGYPDGPDMHLSIALAEEIAYLLLQAVEDAVKADLDLTHE